MPLPSQSARPTSRRSHMYSRRRHRGRQKVLIVAGVIAVGGLAWWFWPQGDTGTADATEEAITSATDAPPSTDVSESRTLPVNALAQQPSPKTSVPKDEPTRREQRADEAPMAAAPTTLIMGQPLPKRPQRDGAAAPQSMTELTGATLTEGAEDMSASEPARPAATDRGRMGSQDSVLAAARQKLATDPVGARLMLSQAMLNPQFSEAERREMRETLAELNQTLVFSPTVVPGDPFAMKYTVQGGDYLQKIVRTTSVQTDWRFVSRINRVDPRRIREGQPLKLITGPFHAVVDKSDYRMDIYLGDGPQQVYVCSLPVGLGQYNTTPEGLFRVKPRSKAVNPAWVNPRTGEKYDADDPENPIGEYWMGLEAVDAALADVIGYGIHGTTEPESIGQQASMGCVRLADDDVKLVYEMLVEEASLVRIVP